MRTGTFRGGVLPRISLSLLLLGLSPALPAEPLPAKPSASPTDPALPAIVSADDARAEFEAVCSRIVDSDETYNGRRQAQEAERLLQADVTGPPRIEVELVLGRELLKLGRVAEAVERLSKTRESSRALSDSPHPLWFKATYELALAHLRAAEDQNCVLHHAAASCLFPIAEEGVHRKPEHARRAGDLLLELLRATEPSPQAIQTSWLLNLSRMVAGDYPEGVPTDFLLPASAFESDEPFPRWHDRAVALGLATVDLAGGAVMDDFDGDGLLDLISSTSDPCGGMVAFRNRGDGSFENVTRRWGLDSQLGGLNLMHADYDGDGKLDLLVLRGAWRKEYGRIRESLLRNELGGTRDRFVDVTHSSGLGGTPSPTQTAAWADYDNDGDLDLYVGNESRQDASYPSRLYRNQGDGSFVDVGASAGVTNDRFAKGVSWGDFDNDGDPDLYVSNLGPNRLYRNNGDGSFTDIAEAAGVLEPSGRSFACWFFDHDNDGDLDLFVADYGVAPTHIAASYFGIDNPRGQPLLYRNDGGKFTELSRELGIVRPSLPMGANFGDIDNDGWLDFYLGTGNPYYDTVFPNLMYRNVEGTRFADVTSAGGFGHLQKGHGVAFGDLDNDGDQDLFHQVGGFYPGDAFANALFENPGNDASWITLRLKGQGANRFAVGARIELRVRNAANDDGTLAQRSIHVTAGSGGSFGGSSMQQEIGLGDATRIDEIVVRWPATGLVQRFADVEPDRIYDLTEGADQLVVVEPPTFSLTPRATGP